MHGSIPESPYKLHNLEDLFLTENNLEGIVEFDMFFKMRHLADLSLAANKLSVIFRARKMNSLTYFPSSVLYYWDGATKPSFRIFTWSPTILDWKFVLAGAISGFVIGIALGDMVTTRWRQGWFLKAFGRISRRIEITHATEKLRVFIKLLVALVFQLLRFVLLCLCFLYVGMLSILSLLVCTCVSCNAFPPVK